MASNSSPAKLSEFGTGRNASPIQITCAGHGLLTGASGVIIAGVLGNTAANGVWTITDVIADTFKLTGSSGNGNYTSGGIVIGPFYRTGTYDKAIPARDKTYFAGDINFQSTPAKFTGPIY